MSSFFIFVPSAWFMMTPVLMLLKLAGVSHLSWFATFVPAILGVWTFCCFIAGIVYMMLELEDSAFKKLEKKLGH